MGGDLEDRASLSLRQKTGVQELQLAILKTVLYERPVLLNSAIWVSP